MTTGDTSVTLRRLGDSNLTVAFPDEDVRGRDIIDRDGEEIGTVTDLIIDDRQARVRFLEVGSGGVLGLGETKVLIPVDAITRIMDDSVRIDRARRHVAASPRYAPTLAGRPYWEDLYGYYGYGPYWVPGYVYPPYPYYPR